MKKTITSEIYFIKIRLEKLEKAILTKNTTKKEARKEYDRKKAKNYYYNNIEKIRAYQKEYRKKKSKEKSWKIQ